MNQRTSPEITLTETRAGLSRRAMMAAAPTLGLAATTLGLGARATLAKDQEATEIGRLYASWKRVYESPLWQSEDKGEDQGCNLADSLFDLEQRIAALPSASIMDVYQKLVIADVHDALDGFDMEALVAEARQALGAQAPVL